MATKAASTIGKKVLKQQYLPHMSSQIHSMANFGPLTAEIVSGVWSQQISTGFASLLLLHRYRSPEANQTLHDVWPFPGLVHCIYILGGLFLLDGISAGATFTLYVQVLRSPIMAALLHGTTAACVSHTLRRGARSGITELSQRAPPIFGWAAITLGVGPHF